MKWIYQQISEEDVRHFSKCFRLPELYTRILLTRGIRSNDDFNYFFNKNHHDLHDPFLMKNMDLAVIRITQALAHRETLLVYGDYDVDGVTSTSLLVQFFRQFLDNVYHYIPDREKDGYGVSRDGIDYALEKGAKLIITCDCGITAVDQSNYAAEKGIDMIITDHHEPAEDLPDALAVIDPKQHDDKYPFRELCGAGVAYKLILACCLKWNEPEEKANRFIDLAAIGTAADIVPLVNENRIIMKEGLSRIRRGEASLGIKKLMEIASVDESGITVESIVFGLAPRLNAVGRMGAAGRAVKLLTTGDSREAKDYSVILNLENNERKKVEAHVVREAVLKINQKYGSHIPNVIILAGNWHSGVIGIVSSKIREKYNRPVIMISVTGNEGKGSGRSIPGLDLHRALTLCSNYLSSFGGHQMAAGLTIDTDRLDEFELHLQTVVADMMKDKSFEAKLHVDAKIDIRDIDTRLMQFMSELAPFGPGNMKPKFCLHGIKAKNPQILKDLHLKFRISHNNYTLECLGWRMSRNFEYVMDPNQTVDMVIVPVYNEWNGNRKIQCIIKDMRPSEKVSFI